jgi:hypothetical protein
MKQFLILILVLITLYSYSQGHYTSVSYRDDSLNASITATLKIPFGTIAKLDVEIYDGDSLQRKEYQGTYLMKINSINGEQQIDTLLMTFEDETGELASGDFELYKIIHGKEARSLSAQQIDKMKKTYVGKKLTLMAYETGRFTGIPKDYFKYRPVRADRNFHFMNYLIIVSRLTN